MLGSGASVGIRASAVSSRGVSFQVPCPRRCLAWACFVGPDMPTQTTRGHGTPNRRKSPTGKGTSVASTLNRRVGCHTLSGFSRQGVLAPVPPTHLAPWKGDKVWHPHSTRRFKCDETLATVHFFSRSILGRSAACIRSASGELATRFVRSFGSDRRSYSSQLSPATR